MRNLDRGRIPIDLLTTTGTSSTLVLLRFTPSTALSIAMDFFVTFAAYKPGDAYTAHIEQATIDKDVALVVQAIAEEEDSDISDYESKDKAVTRFYCVVI